MSHHLIYFTENQAVANEIHTALRAKGFPLTQHAISDDHDGSRLNQIELGEVETPILLLITDNFLKSKHAMDGALKKIKAWADTGWLIPVVAPGTGKGEDGSTVSVPTNFERVSNIIPYMNFWQDKYLELRKRKRNNQDEAELDQEIKQTKDISSDMGELLRFLRSLEHYTVEELQANDYGVYRIATGEDVPPAESKSEEVEDEQALVDIIKGHKDELMAENPNSSAELAHLKSISTEDEEDVDEELLADIPGMDLLDSAQPKPSEETDPMDDPALDAEAASLMDELAMQQPSAPPTEEEKISNDLDDENEQPKGLLLEPEHDTLNSIVDEVLAEEGLGDVEEEEFQFLPEDSNDPNDFNFDALLDEEETPTEDGVKDSDEKVSEEEMALDILLDEDDELVEIDEGAKVTPEEILERALDMFADGETENGLAHLGDPLEDNPGNTSLRYYFAYAQARYAKNLNAAKEQLEILLKQDPQHAEAWYLMGEMAENQTDFEGARKCFEKAVEVNPGYPDIHYRLGLLIVQYFPQEPQSAAEHFALAIQNDEENLDAEYALANLLQEQMGQPEKAAEHFENVLELQPDHLFANYDLAFLHHRLGNVNLALEFYQKAILIDPNLKTEANDLAFGLKAKEIEEEPEVDETVDAPGEESNAEETNPQKEERTPDSPNKSTVVLITGGTAGIGRATAEVFARKGYRLIITGRRAERLDEIKEHFSEAYSNEIQTLTFDVREAEAVKSALESLPEDWRNVDVLINNAGLSRGLAPIQEGKIEDWDTMIDTNVKGLLYLTRAIAPQMVERRSGHIINVASSAGKEVYPGGNVYCATKAAVEALTKSMRLDLFKHNVRVSQVSPGHVEETEFARVRFDGDEERAEKTYENFQPLKSSDVAEVIYFMATRPAHVNIQDVFLFGTQQAGSNFIDRSGR